MRDSYFAVQSTRSNYLYSQVNNSNLAHYPINTWHHIISVALLQDPSFESFTTQKPETACIYSIHNEHREYVGISKIPKNRVYQHFTILRQHIRKQTKECHFPPKCNLFVYRYIAKHDAASFTHTPIIRMHMRDAYAFEKICITLASTHALNSDPNQAHSQQNYCRIPSLICCIKSTKSNAKKRKRKTRESNKPQTTVHPIQIMLFSTPSQPGFYHRLDSLLTENDNKKIALTIHPGIAHCNLLPLIYSFGNTCIHPTPETRKIISFCDLIRSIAHHRTDRPIHITITPKRTITMTEAAIIFIKQQTVSKEIDTALARKFPTHFWYHIFHAAHKYNDAITTIKIRRFIRLYILVSYKIPPRMITDGIRLNLVLDYDPALSISAITTCHSLIISCHIPHTNCISKVYTSFRKSRTIASNFANHKKYIDEYHPDRPFPCTCTSTHKSPSRHELKMPFEMSMNDAALLRNLEQPDIPTTRNSIMHVTSTFIKLTEKIRTLRLTTTDDTLHKFLSHSDDLNTISITCRNGSITSISISVFTACIIFSEYHVDTSDTRTFLSILACPAFPSSSPTPSSFTRSQVHRLHPLHPIAPNQGLIYSQLRTLLLSSPSSMAVRSSHPLAPHINNNLPGLSFIIQFNLAINNVKQTVISNFKRVFSLSYSFTKRANLHKLPDQVRTLKAKYQGSVWMPIDHNARQYARACALRFHDILTRVFTQDPDHFEMLTNGKSTSASPCTDQTSTSEYLVSKLGKSWLQRTWKTKPKVLAGLFIMVKEDGIRFRIVGTYTKVPHRILLGYASTALLTMLRLSGMKHFSIFQTQSLKHSVTAFDNNLKDLTGWSVRARTFDIKNFYSEVQLTALKERLLFCKEFFRKTNKTDFISVPKCKTDKTLAPHAGGDKSSKFITFSIDTIVDITMFAMFHAFFKLGHLVIHQVGGLATGCPMSGPAAFIYVAFDEHHSKPLQFLKSLTPHFSLLLTRYADDILAILAAPSSEIDLTFLSLCRFIQNFLYEQDRPVKNLIITEDLKNDKYLDSDIIIFNNNSRVKLVYHNKNAIMVQTRVQTIGRFHDPAACSPDRTKINAVSAILVRIADFTSVREDIQPAVFQIIFELACLKYSYQQIRSALLKTSRSRPFVNWLTVLNTAEKHLR